MITATIIRDSVGPHGHRLTTFLLVYPRFILAELNTHRMMSRNSASSRAIPIMTMLKAIEATPAMPTVWTSNGKGMQAGPPLPPEDAEAAKAEWLDACRDAIHHAQHLATKGAHKSIANRLVEPFMHMQTLLSATEWPNFWAQRISRQAQPEFHELAWKMGMAYAASVPRTALFGDWHIPLADAADKGRPMEQLKKIATARAARTSYTNFDGTSSVAADMALHDHIVDQRHMSPFEHTACCMPEREVRQGNFKGWVQYRATFHDENITRVDLPQLLIDEEPGWLHG